MLILLPPSEAKRAAARGKSLDVGALSHPELGDLREELLAALVALCREDAPGAMAALGLGPTQFDLVVQNAGLRTAPTAVAGSVYTGVLYSALQYPELTGTDKRRANRRIAIVSALFGLVSPTDRIPAYRLSGGSKLPGHAGLATYWRDAVSAQVDAHNGLVVDMLSSPYNGFVNLPPDAVTVKVWQPGPGGQRTAVSHFNKATKGHLARALAQCEREPRRPKDVLEVARAAGFDVSRDGTRLDVAILP